MKGSQNPYRELRLRLFAINLGALASILAILLIIVYALMAQELYSELDRQLRTSALHIIHSYIRDTKKSSSDVISVNDQEVDFSLWHIIPTGKHSTAAFVDGNPFINIRQLYKQTSATSNRGYFAPTQIGGVTYRTFTAIVNTASGHYLIYTMKPTSTTDTTLDSLLWTLAVSGIAILAVILAVAIWLATKSIKPMVLSWQRQQQFVADASHELRTPLTIIKTNLDVLLRNPDHTIEAEMQYLANAYEEVTRTTSLIADLLTLARADSKEQLIEHVPVDVSTLISEVVDIIEPVAVMEEKQISCVLPVTPCYTLGDKARLRQLLLILIDNAMRYSGAGAKIQVGVENDTLHTTITVSDTGIGIDAKLLPHVFDRFVRGDRARHRQKQGSGLGLAIAKWIVDAHNGDILISSEVGKGTKVSIILPP